MKGTTIMITGSNAATTGRLQHGLNSHPDWNAIAAVSAEKAIELFHRQTVDVVVLTDDPGSDDAKKLTALFSRQSPDTLLLSFDSNSDNALSEKIGEALENRRKQQQHQWVVNDDVFTGFHAY